MKWKLKKKPTTFWRWLIPRLINNVFPFLGGIGFGTTAKFEYLTLLIIPILFTIQLEEEFIIIK